VPTGVIIARQGAELKRVCGCKRYGLDARSHICDRVGKIACPNPYELPFARSGQGTAFDGLSRYDLTEYNPWYWTRLKQFADLADRKGLVLIHQNYSQHNVIVARAHWIDFRWRPANNVNDTGFPEPPPYAGDKRIFLAEQFYDVNHPARRLLHRAYIRQCLDNFADNSSVIQFIGAEYTGPLHFVQFWIDTILEWERQTGKHAVVGLSVTKDVQDAILADPVRGPAVDVVDIRDWHYRSDGSLYSPAGGQNLAPRQHARLVSPGKTSFEQVYRAVREYRRRYPDKAVMFSADLSDELAWAAFMAGGSLAGIRSGGGVGDPFTLIGDDDMGWGGWLVIERSRSAKNARDVVWNFGANTRHLKSVFQAEKL
jgi:hypothetical protein